MESLSKQTYQKIVSELLINILPRKGPDSYVKFIKALEDTEGQRHIALFLKEKIGGFEDLTSEGSATSKDPLDSSSTDLAQQVECDPLILDNIYLRTALRTALALPLPRAESRFCTWEAISALPVQGECNPCNAAVCTDTHKTLIFRHRDQIIYLYLDSDKSNSLTVIPENIIVENFFRCGDKFCAIGEDPDDKKLKLYQWVDNKLNLITVLPQEHQLGALSAIGDERNNVYIVGGEEEKESYSKKVSCYTIDSNLWEPMPDMLTGRKRCSLAILDNSLYVGGGDTIKGPSDLVQRLPLSTGKWDTLPSTTAKDCTLAAFCEKIVATGGQYKSRVFEFYDEQFETWLKLRPLNVGRSAHGVCVLGNALLVVGGHRAENSIEAFEFGLVSAKERAILRTKPNEELEKTTPQDMRVALENIALRRKALSPGKRGPLAPPVSRSCTWKTISVLPVQCECDPYDAAAVCIDKTLIVRHRDWMLHRHLDQKSWNKCRVVPENINIRNVFKCGNRSCVIGKDFNDKKLKLYEWVHNSELQLITVLPQEHQLRALSAIGDEGNNMYIVGGEVEKSSYSKRVSCYKLYTNLWEPMPDMPTGRKWCSLAILDNSLYVGGGDTIEGPSNLVECLPLSTGKWDTLPSTTAKDCKLAAFCGKIVATGGQYRSTVFEVYMSEKVYDETDGKKKAWLQLPPLNVGRGAHAVCVSGNVLLVVGGHRAENSIEAFEAVDDDKN